MRKMFIAILITVLISLSFALGYDAAAAGASFLGALAGYYLGENIAPPFMILLSKIGMIGEDELFSPFSTMMYDAIDEGRILGSVAGALAVKYIFFEQNKILPGMLLDGIFMYATLKILNATIGPNWFLFGGASGIIAGVVW